MKFIADEESISALAPAAGAGIGRRVADALITRPDFIELMVGAIIEALAAKTTFYVKATGTLESVPDYKTRLQAFIATMAHMEGDPIKRIVHQHLGANGKSPDFVAALRESPELLEAVERQVEKAKFHGRHLKKADTAVADPVESELPE